MDAPESTEAQRFPTDALPFPGETSAEGLTRCRTPETEYRDIMASVKTPQHKRVKVPKDNPIAYTLDGLRNSFQANDSNAVAQSHEAEGRRVVIGVMPMQRFIKTFLPPAKEQMPDYRRAFNKVPDKPKDEAEIYVPFIDAINEHGFCPSVHFCMTSDTPEKGKSGRGALKADFCGFSHGDLHRVERKIVKTQKNGSKEIIIKYESNLGLPEIFGDIKKDLDAFCEDHSHMNQNILRSSTRTQAPKRKRKQIKQRNKSFFSCDNHLDGNNLNLANDTDTAKEERRNFGQSVGYASEVCARQHRTFCFSMMVIGSRIRIFRWDRAGVIVTKALNYKKCPKLLCEFLWRFHLANPIQRGFDPTVTVASRTEEDFFVKVIRNHVALQLGITNANSKETDSGVAQHYEQGKVTKVEVYKKGQPRPDLYLVSVPLESPLSSAGECRRVYWAVKLDDRDKGAVRLLLDVWRVGVTGAVDEAEVYVELGKEGVDNVCGLVCHGDVPEFEEEDSENASEEERLLDGVETAAIDESDTDGMRELDPGSVKPQCTKTDEFITDNWVCTCLKKDLSKRVFKHIHRRIVLEQAGCPLRMFVDSLELFRAALHTLDALDSAYKKCSRIHRDVSLDNILLYRLSHSDHRRGLLKGWSNSIVDDDSAPTANHFRTASWTFVSGRVLAANGLRLQTKEDDMESLFYVVMYAGLRWLPHNEVSSLGSWMFTFFDEMGKDGNGQAIGGRAKIFLQRSGGAEFRSVFTFSNKYVEMWFKSAYTYLGSIADKSPDSGDWTMRNLRRVTSVVIGNLLEHGVSNGHRVENKVSDYFIPATARDAPRATHTSRPDNKDRGSQRRADAELEAQGIPVKRQSDLGDEQSPAAKRRI